MSEFNGNMLKQVQNKSKDTHTQKKKIRKTEINLQTDAQLFYIKGHKL